LDPHGWGDPLCGQDEAFYADWQMSFFFHSTSQVWPWTCFSAHSEVHMHIHGNQANLNTINPYSAAAERAQAAARRAANVNKGLLKSAAKIDNAEGLDEEYLVGNWTNSKPGQASEDAGYRAQKTGKNSDLG
jgi:hypothetical protein